MRQSHVRVSCSGGAMREALPIIRPSPEEVGTFPGVCDPIKIQRQASGCSAPKKNAEMFLFNRATGQWLFSKDTINEIVRCWQEYKGNTYWFQYEMYCIYYLWVEAFPDLSSLDYEKMISASLSFHNKFLPMKIEKV